MLMIRLARFGAKKKPTYRVVVIQKERSRDSSALEVVGHYDPVADPAVAVLNYERDKPNVLAQFNEKLRSRRSFSFFSFDHRSSYPV